MDTNSLFTPLEVAIKVALREDPATLRRLARLEGKVIELALTVPPLRLFIQPVSDGIEFSASRDAEPDCRIKGRASDFLEVLLDEDKAFGSGIELSGDSQLAIDLKRALQRLDIDWEGLLGDRIGDLAAHQIGQCVRGARRYLHDSRERLLDDLSDYLHEELRTVPPRPELEQFYDRVDQLRLQVDRLQARIELLEEARS